MSREQSSDNSLNKDSTGSATESQMQKEIDICGVCEKPIDNPRLLDCLHSFCLTCIQSLASRSSPKKSKEIKCPDCGEPCRIHENESDYVQDYTKITSPSSQFNRLGSCDLCSSDDRPESYCNDCSSGLCTFCTHAHKRQKLTQEHSLTMLENAAIICSYHPSEQVSLFCVECDSLACRDCCITIHRNHSCHFIDEIEPGFSNDLAARIQRQSAALAKISERLETVRDRKIEFESEASTIAATVTEFVEEYISVIRKHGTSVIEQINLNKSSELEHLDGIINEIENLEIATEHSMETAMIANDIGGPHMLLMLPMIKKRLDQLDASAKTIKRCSRYLNFSFSQEKEIRKGPYLFHGDIEERVLANHCHLQDVRKLKTVLQHDPFELTLDTRDCGEVLRRDDITVQFIDTKTSQSGKIKIVDRKDGLFLIRLMTTSANVHTLSLQVDSYPIENCPFRVTVKCRRNDSKSSFDNTSLNPSDGNSNSSPLSNEQGFTRSPTSKTFDSTIQTVTL